MAWNDYDFGGEIFAEAKKELKRLRFTETRKALSA